MDGNPIDWRRLFPSAEIIGAPTPTVSGIHYDSRSGVPGCVFVAVPGAMPPRSRDGHDFIGDALDRGAAVIVVQADHRPKWERIAMAGRAAFVAVPDSRRALAEVAAEYYGRPARHLTTVGVTGTDGKTTTIHLIASLLEAAGMPTGYLSSVEFKTTGAPRLNATHMTTAESPEVQSLLSQMAAAGCRTAVIEASSHGLALNRVDCCEFDVAVFTMLSSDHLDFHRSVDEYLAAKGRLFAMLDEAVDKGVPKTAVLNADDFASEYLRSRTRARALTYGLENAADVTASDVRSEGLSSVFTATCEQQRVPVRLPLAGRHNVYNALAAIAVAHALSLPLDAAAGGLSEFRGVPGRMEAVDCGQPFAVVVDIASTPDALRRLLTVLRPQTKGRLIAVFGCAGERDPGRRDGMGRAAGELADFVVLTNEDPRSEDPLAITDDIARGLTETGRREGADFVRVLDRREALAYAFGQARAGDLVLLAGKGSEQSIVVGHEHIPWDERVVARELLAEMGWRAR
ncbi:MAG: UDP-N-acetylmuramoyl-L-alanyl-D-glutamate--2,6-diaminopimelate ligase [Dehalococcoidia bacterium]|nr:UDP-N-acetylmuramoyl-L-alanyl-D-glutamate--2,6-diaminopimelate ligase [Dehalococcoidia bacterium]